MNPSAAQAQVLVDELIRCGVREAVLCPGSRNAPLSFALHRADGEGRLRLHVRIDERTGGFLALGLALGSGRAVPVVCTSGTAAANLHPAVLEACYAGVPLLALTADRPPELVGTGANQTIVQPGLFGTAPRLSVTLAVAHGGGGGQVASWRSSVARAVAVALGQAGGRGGPVHVNLPFAEPLVPETAAAPTDEDWPESLAGRPNGAPWTVFDPVAARTFDPSAWRAARSLPMDPDAPTLVLAGAVPVGCAAGGGLATGGLATGGVTSGGVPGLPPGTTAPVIAEPGAPPWSSALRTGPWLLDAPAFDDLRPSQVLLLGRPTLHRSLARVLADPRIEVYAVAGTIGGPGPDGAELSSSVRAVGVPPTLRPPPAWCARWAEADAAAGEALDKALTDPSTPTGLRLAASLVTALPDGAVLLLGSSNPVRDVSLAARPRSGLTVLVNRGVAGIDGAVSTATGAALAHAARGGGPGYALLGDLTVLHDVNGLLLGPDEPRPDLTLVVLNDSGGGIFSLLEQGGPEHAASFERVFGTPHRARLDKVCAGFGVAHRLVEDLGDLPSVLADGVGSGVRVVEVPAARGELRAGHAALKEAVAAAVSAAVC